MKIFIVGNLEDVKEMTYYTKPKCIFKLQCTLNWKSKRSSDMDSHFT